MAASVAIHPVVVAGHDHEWVLRFLELAFPRLEPLVGAGPLARSNVPDVDDKNEILTVHLLDHRGERIGLEFAVRRIADQREAEARVLGRRQRRRNVQRTAGERRHQDKQRPHQSRFNL